MKNLADYSTKRSPDIRKSTIDFGRISKRRHSIFGMIELDITSAREKLKSIKQVERTSLFAWLVKEISDHLAENKSVAAYARGDKKIYLFQDINVSVLIEREKEGAKVPHVLVIEGANNKSAGEITREISDARKKKIEKNESVLNRKDGLMTRLYYRLPGFLRRLSIRLMLKNPLRAYRQMGNVVITSVAMMGKVHGWFIHSTLHPVSFGIGAITDKPWVVNDEIKIREILNMTISFDHDIIDGADMARFVNSLVKRLENP